MASNSGPEQIVLIAEDRRDGQQLARTFARTGIEASHDEGLVVVAARNVLSLELSRINRRQLRRRRPWMLIRLARERIWVGPVFIPGRTGCWECLAHRLQENGWTDSEEVSDSAMLERAVREIRGSLRFTPNLTVGRILVFTAAAKAPEVHELTRRPQCPACGRTRAGNGRAIRLQSRLKVPRGLRICSAEDTLIRLARHESELTGIITKVRPAAGWRVFPVFLAQHCRPLAARSRGAQVQPQPVTGKGVTVNEARASCLAEAVERYSIQWQGDEPRHMARKSRLGERAFGLGELALWSARQLRGRKRWNREVGGFSYIPNVPDEDARMEWTPVWSLTEGRRKYVPTAYLYLYYPSSICFADSNGCAAGNVIEEAILHGFLELVEREAVGIWWYNRLQRPAVQVDGPMKARYESVREELRTRGRTLTVLDLTTDFDVPVFAAVSALQNGRRIFIGTGAHLNAEVALNRALGELCQVLESLENGLPNRHGRLTTVEQAFQRWMRHGRLKQHPYLAPGGGEKSLREFRNWSKRDVKKEVEWCVSKARELGLEFLVRDMTRPDIDFPVVRVIVPGMRHCWGRFAPGRLYDVPVKMGWLKRKLRETELNPEAYFL